MKIDQSWYLNWVKFKKLPKSFQSLLVGVFLTRLWKLHLHVTKWNKWISFLSFQFTDYPIERSSTVYLEERRKYEFKVIRMANDVSLDSNWMPSFISMKDRKIAVALWTWPPLHTDENVVQRNFSQLGSLPFTHVIVEMWLTRIINYSEIFCKSHATRMNRQLKMLFKLNQTEWCNSLFESFDAVQYRNCVLISNHWNTSGRIEA